MGQWASSGTISGKLVSIKKKKSKRKQVQIGEIIDAKTLQTIAFNISELIPVPMYREFLRDTRQDPHTWYRVVARENDGILLCAILMPKSSDDVDQDGHDRTTKKKTPTKKDNTKDGKLR